MQFDYHAELFDDFALIILFLAGIDVKNRKIMCNVPSEVHK